MKRLPFVVALFAAFAAMPAFPQAANPFRVGGETHQIAATSSASVPEQLTGFSSDQQCVQIQLANSGSVDVWVELAGSAAAAVPDIPAAGNPGTSLLVKAGTTTVVGSVNRPYISAKTSSGTTTLNAGCGNGAVYGVTTSVPGTGASAPQVEGTAADGAAAAGNPVQVGGVDGSGNAQAILTGTDGRVSENLAQVNAVTVLTGAGATGTGSQRETVAQDTTTIAGSAPGTAGTASAQVVTVQGVTSMTPVQVSQATGTNLHAVLDTTSTTAVTQATASNLNAQVVGAAASGASKAGNPLQIGGVFNTTQPTVSTGQAVEAQSTARGALIIASGVDGLGVTGAAASGTAKSGNPVQVGAIFNSTQPTVTTGQAVEAQATARGATIVAPGVDGFAVTANAGSGTFDVNITRVGGTLGSTLPVAGDVANAATDSGNPVKVSGVYNTLANQPALTTGQRGNAQLDSVGNVKVTQGAPAIGNILVGRQTFTSTTGATTLITITAGKTWVGTLAASVDCNSAAALTNACKANAIFTTVGANTTPAAGTYLLCQATSGANAATGTVGTQGSNFCSIPFIVSCASGTCTVAVASTNAGSASLTEAFASGVMQ